MPFFTRIQFTLAAAIAMHGSQVFAAAPVRPLVANVASIPSPCGPGAMGSSLVTSAEGEHWLSWLEPVEAGQHALKCARFDAARSRWGESRLIARGAGWFVNWADFPALAVQKDRLTAAWFVGSHGGGGHHGDGYHAEFSVSTDGGATWSAPQPLTRASDSVEFVAFQPLPDGRLLAAWLDGRARRGGKNQQALYSRVLGGEIGADVLVDDFVCDCCQLSFVPTADGGALLAYRGRTKDEVRDMRTARFRAGRWEPSQLLHADGWKIAGCPVNGPQLASSREHVTAAWFTVANNQPRVYLARAKDRTAEFGLPTQIDLGRPAGRVDCAVLSDGAAVVTWLENSGTEKEGGIFLRVQSPRGELSAPMLLAPTTTARASGFPRITLLHDASPAQFLLCYTQEGTPSKVVTALVTVR
ncbi:MAG: sialidase family protein [Opitutaceae bacterium]|nr:sialidase family protein [Opitutaceae bacterium]